MFPIGLTVTDRLDRRLRRRGRGGSVGFIWIFVWVLKLLPEGPGEMCIALEEEFCWVGVGVR